MAKRGPVKKSGASENKILEEIRTICGKLMEKQNEQDESIKNSTEKQDKVLEELQLIRGRLDEVESKLNDKQDNSEDTESIETDEPMDTEKDLEDLDVVKEPITGKAFVLKHTFKNILNMEANKRVYSPEEEYFGVPWRIFIIRHDNNLALYLSCAKISLASKTWTIETDLEVIVTQKDAEVSCYNTTVEYGKDNNGKVNFIWGWADLIEWKELEEEYLIDGNLTVEAEFKVKSMTGIYKNDLRSFDESTKEFSDVVLVVQDEKFYVSKLTLAVHSSYFKSMFLGQFGESKKSEITLTGIDSDDFQNFLEVLYAESAIDEFTVEGLLLLADMYDTKLVCENAKSFF